MPVTVSHCYHPTMDDQRHRPADEPDGGRPAGGGQPDEDARRAGQERRQYEDPVDDAADDSFPASDPPSFTDATATHNPHR